MSDEQLEKTLSSKEKYRGGIIGVKVDEVELSNGKTSKREVVEHPGAVAVVAEKEGKLLLLRQFRYPTGEVLLEIPAGKLEKGEEPAACAHRELLEETGFEAKGLHLLSQFYTSPGFCNETVYLFQAEEILHYQESPLGDGEENLQLAWLTREEAIEGIKNLWVKDAKTIIGILSTGSVG